MERAYRDKLIQFNATEKYKSELMMLASLLDPKPEELIVDFGCGIGTAVDYLKKNYRAEIFGHDTNQYIDPAPAWYRKSVYFEFDKLYFMHSIAHVQNIEYVLGQINNLLAHAGIIVVITPNKKWVESQSNPNYKPDLTVIHHYSLDELKDLFKDYNILNSGQFGQEAPALGAEEHERIYLVAQKK